MHSAELASGTIIRLAIASIRFYQRFLSPLKGASCRFYPSCSEYSILSLQKHGLMLGFIKALLRLAKCHPFHPGGYDPVH
jgi:putative membrane protein insertion efficiency factor